MTLVIAYDPSGNFGREGNGTTGICHLLHGEPILLKTVKATNYLTELDFWEAQANDIIDQQPNHVVIEGYKLYNHKGKEASIQANSDMQTSQVIGILKMTCHQLGIPCKIQYASEVKTRWNDDLLVRSGYLQKEGSFYYFDKLKTATHHRDALRHAVHFWRYNYEHTRND